MSATLQAMGLVPVRHFTGGTIRVENRGDGIASGYATSLFTGTPVKNQTDGTLIATGVAAADPCIGVFQGCEFSSAGKRWVIPYWPGGQTYDAGTMIAKFTADPTIVYEGQSKGSIAMASIGDGINLGDASQGSTFTGFSSQGLAAASTGATAATFRIIDKASYPDNAWGDAFTKLLVVIQAYQGQTA